MLLNDDALRLLLQLRHVLDKVTHALALRCSHAQKLDVVLLDQLQVPTFELAWASAELLAAQSSLRAMTVDSSQVDRRLVLVFVVQAIILVIERLQGICVELDLPDQDLLTLAAQGPGRGAS